MLHSHSDLIAEARAAVEGHAPTEAEVLAYRLADALEVAEKRATEAEADRDSWIEQTNQARQMGIDAYVERDAALAVIEKARECLEENEDRDVVAIGILSSASTDVLRERDAEKWDEGAQWAAVELGAIDNERQAWITPTDNPYRPDRGGEQ